jgi:hypothetical protein
VTKLEDLPLKRDETVSFTITVNQQFWDNREWLAEVNHPAAVELAYLTIGFGTFTIDVDSMTHEYVDADTPEPMFGIRYTWNVYVSKEED